MGDERNGIERAAGWPESPGYRYADVVGDRLHVAGQVPLDRSGVLVGVGDPAVQARACVGNLFELVELHGFARSDIHQLVVHVVGEHADLIAAWEAVAEAFDGDVPPATLLGVHLLGYRDQLVELDATIRRA